jgi:hypothetical protein
MQRVESCAFTRARLVVMGATAVCLAYSSGGEAFIPQCTPMLVRDTPRELPVTPLAEAPCAGTLDDAARAALAVAMPLTRRAEYGGAIFEIEGRYCYTVPVTSGHSHEVRFHAEGPAGARLAGVYHTHRRHDAAAWFSQADIETAKRLGVPSYIGVVSRREVRLFDPTRMEGRSTVLLPMCGEVSRGELLAADT